MRRTTAIAGLMVLGSATMASAERKPDQSVDMGESDRIICIEIAKPGSRIAKSKSCHTAAEWAEIRRQQKDTTSRIQTAQPRSY